MSREFWKFTYQFLTSKLKNALSQLQIIYQKLAIEFNAISSTEMSFSFTENLSGVKKPAHFFLNKNKKDIR